MEIPLSEILSDIEEFAGMMLSKDEIAISMDFPVEHFRINKQYQRAFEVGHQKANIEHKKKIQLLAKQGSSPAQTHLDKIALNVRLNEIKNAWQ